MRSFACLLACLLALGGTSCHRRSDPQAPEVAVDAADLEAILASSQLPALLPEPLPGDAMGVTIHRLSNGMTVYISTSRDEPRVQGWIGVRAGGTHDPAHATGLAHYLEHMLLFKGTDELGTIDHAAETPHLDRTRELYRELANADTPAKRDQVLAEIDSETQAVARTSVPNEISHLYDRLGFSDSDGHTEYEYTWYHTLLPANRIAAWATITGEQFGDPVFRLFHPELEAVYEEKNRGLDSPDRRMFEAMMKALFPAHPYGTQTVLGEPEHLKTPAFDEMVAFFERWYVPNNMAIVLAGDVDASVLPLLERRFGHLRPKRLPAPRAGEPERIASRVEHTVVAPGEPSVRIAWPTVAIDHEDTVALAVVEALLDDTRVGALSAQLLRPGKATWAAAWSLTLRDAGALVVEAPVRADGSPEAIEAALRRAVASVRDVTPARLEAIKLRVAMDRAFQLERTRPRASRMLDAFVSGLDWSDVVAREQRLDALQVADVQRVVDRYLGEVSVVVRHVRGEADAPKLPKPDITPLKFADPEHSPLGERIANMPADPIEPVFLREGETFERIARPFGEVIASKNTRNDLFTLIVAIDRGYRDDPLLCHALETWANSGSAELGAAALQERLFELGATVGARCDDRQAAIHIAGIDRNFADTLAVVQAWLRAPVLDRDRIQEAATSTISARAALLDDEDAIDSALRDRAYFGRESPELVLPSNAAIRSATPKRLRASIVELLRWRHRVLYFGPRPGSEIADAAAFGKGDREPTPRWTRNDRSIENAEIHVVHRESAKATVRVLFAGPPIANGREAEPALLSWELGNRAWDDIRGARALAYSVSAGVDTGRVGEESALWGFLQAQPDKVGDAVPAMLAVLGVPRLERAVLGRAQNGVRENLRPQRVDPRNVPSFVDAWRNRGLDRDPRSITWSELDRITVESTGALYDLLRGQPAIITIVGDTARIDMARMESLGTVQLHEPGELFAFE